MFKNPHSPASAATLPVLGRGAAVLGPVKKHNNPQISLGSSRCHLVSDRTTSIQKWAEKSSHKVTTQRPLPVIAETKHFPPGFLTKTFSISICKGEKLALDNFSPVRQEMSRAISSSIA